LLLTSNIPTKTRNRISALDFSDRRFSAGIDLVLPFDQKSKRNNYRRALIDLDVRRRSAALNIDLVKLDVRNSWRNLEQAKRNYEIGLKSIQLNEDRVEEVNLKAELGLGSILDQVDAQNDLTNAQTSVTNSLVRQKISMLEFWRDIGVLYIQENGQWEKLPDA
jgi:outer membrane protein TolC